MHNDIYIVVKSVSTKLLFQLEVLCLDGRVPAIEETITQPPFKSSYTIYNGHAAVVDAYHAYVS